MLVVDDATYFNLSYIQKKKSDLTENMIQLILDLKNKNNVTTKFIRYDNTGRNKKLEEECKKKGLWITLEYTAVGTPQQNGKV